MFDDQQPNNSGQVPNNLPTGEPEDILAGTEAGSQGVGAMTPPATPTTPAPATEATPAVAVPTALNAGILKPKEPEAVDDSQPTAGVSTPGSMPTASATPSSPDVVPGDTPTASPLVEESTIPHMTLPPEGMTGQEGEGRETYQLTEPVGNRKVILWIIIIVIVLVLGIGTVWIYFSFIQQKDDSGVFNTPAVTVPKTDTINTPAETTDNTQAADSNIIDTQEQDDNLDDQILFGEPIDTDGDGLDDVREADLYTDPLNWDSDGDELSDGDEVTIWKTDPLAEDTDGDGFLDGTEVKNGYNPAGPGRLFEPPTTTDEEI